jgi:hypothetical protein
MLERTWKGCENVRNKKLGVCTAMTREEWRQLLRDARTYRVVEPVMLVVMRRELVLRKYATDEAIIA